MDDLLYFIYLLSTSVQPEGIVDVIVPDYSILAKRILEEDVNDPEFIKKNIVTTTKVVNDPSCPHASVWSSSRAKYFFELEGRFEVLNRVSGFKFDGRDIYLRFFARRLRDK